VAAVKGDLRMVEVCRRALVAAVPPLPPTTRFAFEGTTVEVGGATLDRVRARLLDRVRPGREAGTYHGRAGGAAEALRAALWKAWKSAHRSGGGTPPEDPAGSGFEAALDASPQVTLLRRCFWPDLDPVDVLGAVAGGDHPLAEVAAGVLEPDEVAQLDGRGRPPSTWTIDDVGLLDEVAALLGRHPAPPPARPAGTTAGSG
jgi:hypothetical protein